MKPIPELTTPRLRLRGWEETDADDWRRICGDPETMRHIGDGTTMPADRAWHALAHMMGHWAFRGYGLWAVTDRETEVLLGRAGLYNPEGWYGLELGWLIDRSQWGRGIATEAARAAAAWAMEQLAVSSLVSLIYPENVASVRVATKLGGRHKERIEVGDREVDVYEILLGSPGGA